VRDYKSQISKLLLVFFEVVDAFGLITLLTSLKALEKIERRGRRSRRRANEKGEKAFKAAVVGTWMLQKSLGLGAFYSGDRGDYRLSVCVDARIN
jgi:hypothetical protein